MMSMQRAKPLPTLALPQGSRSSSLLDPFFLLLSPRPLHCHHTRRHQTNDVLFVDIFLINIFLINILLVAPFLLHFSLPSSLPSNTSTSSSTTSYSSHRIVPAPTAVSVTRRAVLTMPQSSPSCSPPPTSYRPHRPAPSLTSTRHCVFYNFPVSLSL